MDETMLWIFHRTFREIQKKALETDLRRILFLLLRHPVPEAAVRRVRADFQQLTARELAFAKDWNEGSQSRWQFQRLIGWTNLFHTALLRDFALAESILRNPSAALHLERLRSAGCYYPASDQPGWAAWSVVLELAIRKTA
jgi:hypothetical protein